MICPNCGKEYNEKMTCCISCGAELVHLEDSGQTVMGPPGGIPELPELPEVKGGNRAPEAPEQVSELPEPDEVPLQMKGTANPLVRAARFTGSFLVSLLMFGFLLLFSASAALRLATSDRVIEEFSESLDLLSLPAEAVPTEGYDVAPDATVQEAVYVMSRGTGLSREDIRAIYESSTMKGFLAGELKGYARYVRTGAVPEPLTSGRLEEVFSENINLISSTMGIPLSQHDIDLACTEIEKLRPVLDSFSPSAAEDRLGAAGITVLRVMCSLPALIVIGALAIAMLPLLRAVNKSSGRALRWGAAPLLAAGAVTALAVFLLTLSPGDTLAGALLSRAAGALSPYLYGIAAVMGVSGLIMLPAAKIIKN